MRKLIWYCSAAGVLAAGGFLSLAYYACRCPSSTVGRSMRTIVEASLAMQPLSGLASMAMHTNSSDSLTQETAGSDEECIPDDPQPIVSERKEEVIIKLHAIDEVPPEAAPIVIVEEDTVPVVQPVPSTIEIPAIQGAQMVANGCPIVMPYCQDDGEPPITPPIMPRADEEDKPVAANEKQADASSDESENKEFKEWMKLFEEGAKKDKRSTAEALPTPTEEEPQTEPKCQEDSHLHEHYSGCPRVTCPYTGKSYPVCEPSKQVGTEEISEEPPQLDKKLHPGKAGQETEECPRTPGVDTMEYRKSDGGLNEFGPGPLH